MEPSTSSANHVEGQGMASSSGKCGAICPAADQKRWNNLSQMGHWSRHTTSLPDPGSLQKGWHSCRGIRWRSDTLAHYGVNTRVLGNGT